MRKVNLETLKPWISSRLTELLDGVEDEARACLLLLPPPPPFHRMRCY